MIANREHLLGYLLGALEPAEMAEVERELEHNPQLRQDLAAIEAAMFPLGFPERDDDASHEAPPSGLIARTCEFVADAKEAVVSRPAPAMSPASDGGQRSSRWADIIVTTSVCLAALSLIFPAIWTVREQQHITACQDNLRSIGLSLAEYAGRSPNGRIPQVAASGNRSAAGIYSVLLMDRELLGDSRRLICPSSDLAQDYDFFRVPSLGELDRARGEGLIYLQGRMGGSYGYNLGFVENGEYQAPRHQSRSHYCLMSDAPATFPQRMTKNHRSRGQNLLYEDNSVRWMNPGAADLGDDPHLNRNGLVAAGLDCADVVVAESLAKPLSSMIPWLK